MGSLVAERASRWDVVGIVPQRLGLLDELTLRENVRWPARLSTCDAPESESLLSRLQLADFADRYPAETSLGEQQRAALARALVLGPRMLVVDEPTGHQDEESASLVFELLREAAADGAAVLVATHDEHVVRAVDRVVRMHDGRVLP